MLVLLLFLRELGQHVQLLLLLGGFLLEEFLLLL